MKYIAFVVISLTLLTSCTASPESHPYTPVSGETQVPPNARIEPGYKYPSVPLSEFQSSTTVTGTVE